MKRYIKSTNTLPSRKRRITASENVRHYRLIDYFDVWGNEEDGWEVNNLGPIEDDIIFVDDVSDQEILDYLIDTVGWLSPDARNKVRVESWDPDFIEFFVDDTDMPLGRLEATR